MDGGLFPPRIALCPVAVAEVADTARCVPAEDGEGKERELGWNMILQLPKVRRVWRASGADCRMR